MNVKRLTKLYDQLTPAERLPLIFAARLRGDATEEGRLRRAAPTQTIRRPDYSELATRLDILASLYVAGQLELLCHFHHNAAIASFAREPFPVLCEIVARVFLSTAQGWHTFCDRHGFDPTALCANIPGIATIAAHTGWLELAACDIGEAEKHIQSCDAAIATTISVEAIADAFHHHWVLSE